MMGGIKVAFPDLNCTFGFKAKLSGISGFATMGHCVDDGMVGVVPVYAGQPSASIADRVGLVLTRFYQDGNNGDCLFVKNTSERAIVPHIQADQGDPFKLTKTATAYFSNSVIAVGFRSGEVCGSVIARNVSVLFTNGIRINGLTHTTHRGLTDGDSGAVLIKDLNKLTGLLSGIDPDFLGESKTSYFLPHQRYNEKFGPGFSWDFN